MFGFIFIVSQVFENFLWYFCCFRLFWLFFIFYRVFFFSSIKLKISILVQLFKAKKDILFLAWSEGMFFGAFGLGWKRLSPQDESLFFLVNQAKNKCTCSTFQGEKGYPIFSLIRGDVFWCLWFFSSIKLKISVLVQLFKAKKDKLKHVSTSLNLHDLAEQEE